MPPSFATARTHAVDHFDTDVRLFELVRRVDELREAVARGDGFVGHRLEPASARKTSVVQTLRQSLMRIFRSRRG
jgi:hypothetical protein